VIGLLEDLDAHVVAGPGFGNSRAAVVNEFGELETAVGDLDAAPCIIAGPGFGTARTAIVNDFGQLETAGRGITGLSFGGRHV